IQYTPHLDPPTLHSFPTRRSSDLDLPAARRLEQLVVAGPVGARTPRAVGAGVAVHEVRVHRSYRRLVETETARRRHAQVVVEDRSEEHTSELQSRGHLVCRLLLEK